MMSSERGELPPKSQSKMKGAGYLKVQLIIGGTGYLKGPACSNAKNS